MFSDLRLLSLETSEITSVNQLGAGCLETIYPSLF
jgi:hypothetical protein